MYESNIFDQQPWLQNKNQTETICVTMVKK